MLLAAAYFHGDPFFIKISVIIQSSMNIIINGYNNYKINYKIIKKIHETSDIKDVSIFPSGKILVMTFNYIKIYDINFDVLQTINNYQNNNDFIYIKDENNFIVYSNNNLLFYELFDGNYSLRGIITNLVDLNSVFFFANKYLLCFSNNKIIILKKIAFYNYEMITCIKDNVKSALFFEKEKILISSGENGTVLRKFKKYNMIKIFEEIKCEENDGIANIGNGRAVILSDKFIVVISIPKRQIIKKIYIFRKCGLVSAVRTKNIFFVSSIYEIFIYRKDNLKFLETTIKNSPTESKHFKKIKAINNELYCYLPFYSHDLFIVKY